MDEETLTPAEWVVKRLTRERDEARAEVHLSALAAIEQHDRTLKAVAELIRERDEARAMIAELRTDAGQAAFALANGWPLPEELAALWRCEGCGVTFEEPRTSHGKAAHAPGCDGSCRFCPVEVECGPITAQREEGR